jgi:hypothetical protein
MTEQDPSWGADYPSGDRKTLCDSGAWGFINMFTRGRHCTSLSLYLSLSRRLLPFWSIADPWNPLFHFSFLLLRPSVGLLGREISPSQGRNLHRTTKTQNKRRQTSMPWVGFEPTIPVFEREKTFHALNRTVTVIGPLDFTWLKFKSFGILIQCKQGRCKYKCRPGRR